MRLRVERVKELMGERGVDAAALSSAIERPAIRGDKALSAVNNWLSGRDHPRCKGADIRAIAQALGASLSDVARFTSEVRFHRGSTQKARLVADMVRGKPVDEALNSLSYSGKRAATNVRKALSAAIADAEQHDADITSLIVGEMRVDEGPQIKRFRPKDRGRAHRIIKQTSHITISVEERVERPVETAGGEGQ